MNERIRILIDVAHDNLFFSKLPAEESWKRWNEAEKLIENLKLEVEFLEEFNEELINIKKGQILIIGGPQKEYTTDEIDLIVKFTKNSGSLFVMHNYGGDLKNKTNLNKIMKKFGIEFQNDLILDEINNVQGFVHGPIINDLEKTPIFFNVKDFSLILGCSLKVSSPAREIARSHKNSYTKKFISTNTWQEENSSKKIVAAIVDEIDLGRIFAIGDLHLFSDDDSGLKMLENAKLFENILIWLSEPFISISENIKRINQKMSIISRELIEIKEKTGLMEALETSKGIVSSKLYTPDELALKVKKLETDLARDAEISRKGELDYFSKRVRYQFIALIISIVSIFISIIIVLINIFH
ncbi:MAG: Gldg family protein [Candidatus Helarchaeota archaeon]